MKKNIISAATINELYKIVKNREKKHQTNVYSDVKELEPVESLESVEFNAVTRMTKINYLWQQNYRTITRYVTRNYQKYPIYSTWKTKSKLITKTIKLTNSMLEKLNRHEDELIRRFSDEIIIALNDESLIPSWLQKKYLKLELDVKVENIKLKIKKLTTEKNNYMQMNYASISNNKKKINFAERLILIKQENIVNIENKINKIKNIQYPIILLILTLGIAYFFISTRRLIKLTYKMNQLIESKNDYEKKIANLELSCKELDNDKIHYLQEFNNQIENINKEIKMEEEKTYQKIKLVSPLIEVVEEDFLNLKELSGLTYENIVGCYIIWNTEFNKYYVGQSKDVMKRLNQHFKGTLPKNIIFAEDYYKSNMVNKEDIFKIKIIKCYSKDELDKKERELINQYDSFRSGYNGTSGNI